MRFDKHALETANRNSGVSVHLVKDKKMTARKNKSIEVTSLRTIALAFDNDAVETMQHKLSAAFDARDIFEESQGLSLVADSSYVRERNKMLNASVGVSRFFLALNVEPSAVILRKVVENKMFNAKALKKITELAQFTCGYGEKLERVTRAFIACTIIATDRGATAINNRLNVQFLHGADLSAVIADADLIAALDDMRHRAMTSGAETQSSQARNVLDVLNIGAIRSVDKSRDAIELNASHAFVQLFRERFMV